MSRSASLAVVMFVLAVALGALLLYLTGDLGGEEPARPLVDAHSAQQPPALEGALPGGGGPSTLPSEPEPLVPTSPAAAPVQGKGARGPTRSVRGTVLRLSDDSPLPSVRVTATPKGQDAATGVLTLAQPAGAFLLAKVPVDVEQLTVISTGPWPERRQSYALEPGQDDLSGLVLRFDSGFTISGLVTDEQGVPIPAATIDVGRHTTTSADENGQFRVHDVAPSTGTASIQVFARAPGFERAAEAVIVPRDAGSVPHVVLSLTGSGAVEGYVVDRRDVPVSEARVTLSYVMTTTGGERVGGLEASTDARGHYLIDHVPAGRYLVQARPGGVQLALRPAPFPDERGAVGLEVELDWAGRLARVWISGVSVAVPETTRLDITLPNGSTIEGRVTDQAGSPVPGARLKLEHVVRWPAPDLRGSIETSSGDYRIVSRGEDGPGGETILTTTVDKATSGDRGKYTFEHVSQGEKTITATDPEHRRVTRSRTLTVLGDESREHVDLQLPTGVTMRSRVVDPLGLPIESASVWVFSIGTPMLGEEDRVSTDQNGRFEVTGLEPGEMRLRIMKDGYKTVSESVDPASAPALYEMQPALRVQGTVTDAIDGDPIPWFTVKLDRPGWGCSKTAPWHEGNFHVDVQDDDPVTVSIAALGYLEETRENVRPSDTATLPLQFRLVREP